MAAFLKIVRVTTKPMQVRETASVEISRDAAVVWAYMWDPASIVEISELVEVGVSLPGTPSGLGEVQAFVWQTGQGRGGSIHETVEFEPGRRAKTRMLDAPHPSFGVVLVEPLGPGSCRFIQEYRMDFPAGTPLAEVQKHRTEMKLGIDKLISRLAELAPQMPEQPDVQ